MGIRATSMGLIIFCAVAVSGAEVLDRMVASVNGHVILLSDWNDEIRFECFSSGSSPADVTAEEKQAALERLIDQELIQEQMRLVDEKPIGAEKVEKQIESLKTDYLRDHPEDSWDAALAKYYLSQKLLEAHIASELQEFQLIDARFRPSVQVSAAEVESYYRDQFVPKLPPADPVSLTEATPKIREILVQGKINQMLNAWLETLRAQAQIQIAPNGPGQKFAPPKVAAP